METKTTVKKRPKQRLSAMDWGIWLHSLSGHL